MTYLTGSGLATKRELLEASRLERSNTHKIIREMGGGSRRELANNLLAFCRVLRTMVPGITTGRILDASQSLLYIDISNRWDIWAALKPNLISSKEDGSLFDILFQMFFDPIDSDDDIIWLKNQKEYESELLGDDFEIPESVRERISELISQAWESSKTREHSPDTESPMPSYSPNERLAYKDFGDFNGLEIKEMRRVIALLAPKLASVMSRRMKTGGKGKEVDMRRTFRSNLRYGGEIVSIRRRRRKTKKLRIALLCDVSGSMDLYSRFLIQFMYAMENEMTGIDSWVFSTRLTNITKILRNHPFEEAIKLTSKEVSDWSGGTAIGSCLMDFANGAGKRKVTSHTVIIIVSDGWDRGNVKALEESMKVLKRRSLKIVWLNPLLGSPNYQPLAMGIKTALPYVDYFLPAHNLDSLIKLSKTLQEIHSLL